MNQEIKNIIETTTDMGAQYDACAKRILGQKIILGMDWKENCMNYFHFTDEPVL